MANIIINDPSDRQMEIARTMHRLQTDPRLREKVNTEVSDRMAKKHELERPLTQKEICKMKFIPWDLVAKTLSGLNKSITYTRLPDGKIGIGFLTPSRKEVADWEKLILTSEERREVQRLGNHQGPRPFVVAASQGYVAPYTRLLTKSMPVQIICRSLVGICRVLIAHGAFTWPEAERAFGFRMLGPGTEETSEYLNLTPRVWAETRPSTRLE